MTEHESAHPAKLSDSDRERILSVALDLGEAHGWDAVQLHQIAGALGVTLADIYAHFEHKDAIAEAWFDLADRALLEAPSSPDWMKLSPRERLHRTIFAWLNALAGHRRLTAAMLRYKLQPEHIHLQVLGLTRISRTVQRIREVAGLDSGGWMREMEEAVLTGIYLSTFTAWLRDDSPGAERTQALLERLLGIAEQAALRLSQAR